jgi:nucleoside-diphosphate-sugar epimerase
MLQNPHEIDMGYAEPWRNFIYVDDLVNAWMAVITNPDKVNNGTILTIGPDNALSIQDYAEKIATKLNWQGQINWNKRPIRDGEIYWLNSNHNLITKLLGWEPKTTLDEGLDKTIEVWKKKIN